MAVDLSELIDRYRDSLSREICATSNPRDICVFLWPKDAKVPDSFARDARGILNNPEVKEWFGKDSANG